MSNRTSSARLVLALVALALSPRVEAAPPVDCNCVTNLPGLTVTCPGIVPDLCALAANCFGTNMMPGTCTQNFPPGMQFPAGTYSINLQVMDTQSNYFSCAVPFVVNPQVPTPNLTVSCPTNKIVQCGSGWSFDQPVVLTSCCGVTMTTMDNVISNGTCSQVIARSWQITDGCGNTKTCSQVITTVDTTPPGSQCGANLVPNPSFESFTNCPNSISLFDLASPWFTPSDGTSDLFSPCAGPSSYVATPTNFAGVQIPLTGQSYAGAVVWSVYGLNTNSAYRDYREHVEVQLMTPLTSGQRYQVSFYVSRADNYRYAIAEMGACLTPGPLITNGYSRNFPVVPQIQNPSTNLLASTNSWMLVQGTFIASGGESYLTLGNFRTDAATTYATFSGPTPDYAYYYFDDVSVVALCDPMTNKTVQCGEPWVFDNMTAFDNCSGNNVTASVNTTTNGFCPQTIQREWSLADPCGNTNLLTQTVTIVDTNPPLLLCVGGANLVPNPHFENYSYCPYFFNLVSDASPWFNPTVATPDYLNTCATFWPVGVPNNLMGSQTPYSGNAYMGAFAYSVYGTNPVPGYREYIEAPLLAPLQAGTTYQVSFRVSLADFSGWAIANLGAHFSVGPIINGAIQSVLNYVPQIANPPNNLLTSTNSWMLVQGTFTATGGEDHITLGNFLPDASTTATNAAGTNHAYYYYDDVSVVPLCSFTNKTVQCGSPWGFDIPLAYDVCGGDSVSTTILNTTTNGTCPQIFTRVWTIADACGNSIMATQSVTVVDTTPPAVVCSGINLVPNPSFESYAQCPVTTGNTADASPWYAPTDGTSDYFNACATLISQVSVPTNFPGVQTPFTGQGYAGAYVYNYPGGNDPTNSYREYLQTPLLSPLIAGQAYAVSFYVNRGDNHAWAVAEIGAHFSVGAVTNYVGPGGMVLPVVPQLENPSTNLLSSTNSWMLIQGTIIAAGGENFLTLGSFRSDTNTTAVLGGGPYSNAAYYYFDEVSVVALCQVSNKIIPCGAAWSFDPPLGFDLCSGTNVTIAVTSTITNSLCPLFATRTWALTDVCGNSNVWSQTVTASTNGSLTVNCGCLQDGALALLTTNACQAVVPNLSVLSNSPCISNSCGGINIAQSPAAGTVVGVGMHNITVKISNCAGITNTCVLPFFVDAPQPTITCPPNLYVLTCSTSAVVNFNVNASGNAGPVICSPPSGSAFPIGTNLVSCTVTSSCGGVASCGFYVIVRPVSFKFGCLTKAIGIINTPMGSARMVHLPDFPGGGAGVDFDNLGSSGQDGVRFDLGPAQKFTFSTVLDFAAPEGARFDLTVFDAANGVAEPLMSFVRSCQPHCGWNIKKPQTTSPGNLYRSIAISDEGELFSSFTQNAAALDTNVLASITSMNGSTSAVMTVTLDCLTHEITLAFPECDWTPDNARKGWDGYIYGNGPRASKTNKTARLILTPLTTILPPPITTLDLLASNLTSVAFDNPSITTMGRKWGDGHVTLMKAYDDGEQGLEFFSLGNGGGVSTDLGHAASFQLRIHHFQGGDVPDQEQLFAIRGWPPGTTTNRPPPPVFNLRLAQNPNGTGINCSADFSEWGVSHVAVQLWNGTTLVAVTNHVPASLASSLVTVSNFPAILGCPGVGIVTLSDTNPIIVLSGLDCPSTGCVGTELRILPELSTASTPPVAFTGLECRISDGMDNLIYRLQTTPAGSPVSLNVTATPDGIGLSWDGDGFRLQGAETVIGSWYDLNVSSPVALPANSAVRAFRLRCD